jgi:hypothetical protein
MSTLEKIQKLLIRPIVFVPLLIILITVLAFGVQGSITPLNPSKQVLEKSLGRTDFTVTELRASDEGWQLVQITDKAGDKGNTAYAVIKEQSGEATLKVGPGTYFSDYSLNAAGVPAEFKAEIAAFFKQKRK